MEGGRGEGLAARLRGPSLHLPAFVICSVVGSYFAGENSHFQDVIQLSTLSKPFEYLFYDRESVKEAFGALKCFSHLICMPALVFEEY